MQRLVSLSDAAKQLRVEVWTLRGWRRQRVHLTFVKVGGRVCVLQESIDRLIEVNSFPPIEEESKIGA